MAKTTLKSLSDALADRLTKGALPGELQGFGKAERAEAANFVATAAYNRPPGGPTMVIEPIAANDPPAGMVQVTTNGATEWVKAEDLERIEQFDDFGPENAVPDEEAFDIF